MTLATYITDNFGQIKSQLGWSDSLQIETITEKTLELYGVATEAEATDARKLHAIADVAVWRQALADVSLDYNFSADGASYSRSQQADMIRKNLDDAINAAVAYSAQYAIGVSSDPDHMDWYA
jgi:hypothetical protein